MGEHGGFVEETNAQCCALYDTMRNLPELLEEMFLFEALWMPIRRARQGILEQHSRSDIYLLDEYLKAGALEIVEKHGQHLLQLKDLQKLIETAFQTATKMRLWEKGIPTRFHKNFTEPFNAEEPGQDARITKAGADWFASLPSDAQESFKKEVLKEASAAFSEDRMRAIGKKIQPILDQMHDIPQPISVIIPGDARFEQLLA